MTKKKSNSGENGAAGYEVYLSNSAALVYEEYFRKAKQSEERGDHHSFECALLRQINEMIETILPNDPFNKRFALSGDLKKIFRLHKGRLRIIWVGAPHKPAIQILFISVASVKDDESTNILSRRVAAGEFDMILQNLGVKPRARQLTNRLQ